MSQNKENRVQGEGQLRVKDVENGQHAIMMVKKVEEELSDIVYSKLDPKPIVDSSASLHVRLSGAFSGTPLNGGMVMEMDNKKFLTYTSRVEINLENDKVNPETYAREELVTMSSLRIEIPRIFQLSVNFGIGQPYNTPAIEEKQFTPMGSYTEKRGQVTFMVHFLPLSGCYMTAAALQMAKYFGDFVIQVDLGMANAPINYAAIPNFDHHATPTADHTCLLHHELATRHSLDALNIVYHALEARDVYASNGMLPGQRVINNAGDLPATVFSLKAFHEAYLILACSACGSNSKDQWDADFLLGMCQFFKLQGTTSLGNIWNRVFSNIPCTHNHCVVISNMTKQTLGMIDRNSAQVMASCITLQCVIARAIDENNISEITQLLPQDVSNETIAHYMKRSKDCIVASLVAATNLKPNYFDMMICNKNFEFGELPDENISVDRLNYLKQFATIFPSFITNKFESRLGKYEVNTNHGIYLTFLGKGGINTYDDNGELVADLALHKRWSFKDGGFYLHPYIDYNTDVDLIEYSHSRLDNTGGTIETLNLLDGNTINSGDVIMDYYAPYNYDIIPAQNAFKTQAHGRHLVKKDLIPVILTDFNYEVSFHKYTPQMRNKGYQVDTDWVCECFEDLRGKLPKLNSTLYSDPVEENFYYEKLLLQTRTKALSTKVSMTKKNVETEDKTRELMELINRISSMPEHSSKNQREVIEQMVMSLIAQVMVDEAFVQLLDLVIDRQMSVPNKSILVDIGEHLIRMRNFGTTKGMAFKFVTGQMLINAKAKAEAELKAHEAATLPEKLWGRTTAIIRLSHGTYQDEQVYDYNKYLLMVQQLYLPKAKKSLTDIKRVITLISKRAQLSKRDFSRIQDDAVEKCSLVTQAHIDSVNRHVLESTKPIINASEKFRQTSNFSDISAILENSQFMMSSDAEEIKAAYWQSFTEQEETDPHGGSEGYEQELDGDIEQNYVPMSLRKNSSSRKMMTQQSDFSGHSVSSNRLNPHYTEFNNTQNIGQSNFSHSKQIIPLEARSITRLRNIAKHMNFLDARIAATWSQILEPMLPTSEPNLDRGEQDVIDLSNMGVNMHGDGSITFPVALVEEYVSMTGDKEKLFSAPAGKDADLLHYNVIPNLIPNFNSGVSERSSLSQRWSSMQDGMYESVDDTVVGISNSSVTELKSDEK